MRDQDKTTARLLEELQVLRERVAELERAEAEYERREEALRFRAGVLDQIGDHIMATDLEGRITYINAAQTKTLGWTREELIGKTVDILGEDPARGATQQEILQKTLSDGTWNGVVVNYAKDGSEVIMECRTWVVRDEEGKPVGLCGIATDITERKRAEDALARSEQERSVILESMLELVVYHDLEHRLLWVNTAAASSVGLSPSDLLGRRCYEIWHNRDKPCEGCPVERTFKTQLPQEGEITTPDGRVWFIRGYPVGGPDGELIGAVEVGLDITERKRAEEKAKHLNMVLHAIRNVNQLITKEKNRDRLLQGICDNLIATRGYGNAWIALLDEDGGLITTAQAGKGDEFGRVVEMLKRGELPHCARKALAGPGTVVIDNPPDICRSCPLSSEYGGQAGMSVRLEYGSKVYGVLVVSAAERFISSEEERSLFAEVADDIAFALHGMELEEERKRAEQEREQLQAQLMQAQKMEAIGRLAGGIAHDFNNLLSVITVSTDFLQRHLDDRKALLADARQIEKAAERAASLTRQLLAFSRRQHLRPEVLDLNAVLSDMEKMLQRLIGEDIEFVTNFGSRLDRVRADRSGIEQVVMNLAVNARDAMPNGGRLIVKTENVSFSEADARAKPHARPGRFVCLSVTDTGIGMDPVTAGRIFEPFFSTKEPGEGTGLGLSVVYGIVQQHHGWINVSSKPGRGTTMEIYLPALAVQPEEGTEGERGVEDLPQGNGERILLVEDEAAVRELTSRALRDNGYVVFGAANASEALDIFQREGGRLDLVFSDVVLPGKGGLELVEELLACKPGLAVLLSSGYADHRSHWPAIREKGFSFLQKPYDLYKVLEAVKRVLQRPSR